MNRREQDLAAFDERLVRADHPRASASLRNRLRASLLAAPPLPPRPSGWVVVRPVLGAALAFALIAGGAGYVGASSAPGEPGYVLKSLFEQLELSLARDDTARLRIEQLHAERRRAEAGQLGGVRLEQPLPTANAASTTTESPAPLVNPPAPPPAAPGTAAPRTGTVIAVPPVVTVTVEADPIELPVVPQLLPDVPIEEVVPVLPPIEEVLPLDPPGLPLLGR